MTHVAKMRLVGAFGVLVSVLLMLCIGIGAAESAAAASTDVVYTKTDTVTAGQDYLIVAKDGTTDEYYALSRTSTAYKLSVGEYASAPETITLTAEDAALTLWDCDEAGAAALAGGALTLAQDSMFLGRDANSGALTFGATASSSSFGLDFADGMLVNSESSVSYYLGFGTVSGSAVETFRFFTDSASAADTVSFYTRETYDMSGVSFTGSTVTYDGKDHSLAISGALPQGVSVAYSSNNKQSDAGSYEITATFTGDNAHYPIPSMTATLVIEPMKIDVPSAASGLTYSSSQQTGVAAGTGYALSGDYAATNAGSYTAVATPEKNYVWSDGTSEAEGIAWSIGTAPLKVKTDSAGKVYDGEALTAAGVLQGIVGDETAYITLTGAQTDAGSSLNTYTIVWGSAQPSNYSVTETLGTLTVTRASATVTALAATKVYGDPDPAFTVQTSGLCGSDTLTYSVTRVVGEDVGSYALTVRGDATQGNYTVMYKSPADAVLSITRKPVDVPTGVSGLTYTSVSQRGVEASECYSLSGTVSAADAGSYSATAAVNSNYMWADSTVTDKTISWSIGTAPLTVTTESAEKAYDGTALTAPGSCTGLMGSETATVVCTGSQTHAGSSENGYTITWGTAKQSNYSVVSEDLGTLTVTKVAAVLTWERSAVSKLVTSEPFSNGLTAVTDGTASYASSNADVATVDASTGEVTVQGAGTAVITVSTTEGADYKAGSTSYVLIVLEEAIDISDATIDEIPDQAYTGKAIEPALTVTLGGTLLEQGVDYTVEYTDNVSIGTATADVTGVGVYEGALSTTFRIVYAETGGIEVAGDDRYATAAAIALKAYPQGADGVIVCTGLNFPDALGASSLAGLLGYPIVLTDGDELSSSSESAIVTLGAQEVIIVGGEQAVSSDVAEELGSCGSVASVSRICGDDRIATALQVYANGKALGAWGTTAIVTTGFNYPDALSISGYAFANMSPIFLCDAEGELTEETEQALVEGGFTNVIIVGGDRAVSEDVESWVEEELGFAPQRLSGANRYETSKAIAQFVIDAGGTADGACIATGQNFPDALAGSVLAGTGRTVMLLANEGFDSGYEALSVLEDHASDIGRIYYLGGTSVVTQAVRDRAEEAAGLK